MRDVPIDKPADPLFHRGYGLIEDGALEAGHIRHGRGDIARLHRQEPQFGLAAEATLQRADVVEQLDRAAVADVEDAVGRVSGVRLAWFALIAWFGRDRH